MAKREIDLNRCLFHYTNVTCNRCETICPHQAIHNRQINAEECDNCGLNAPPAASARATAPSSR